jgi:predicted lipid-binding transport protein (Tim44 family)
MSWIQSLARLAAVAAALLIGADADASVADGFSFGAGEFGVSISSPMMAAAAETAMARHAALTAQVGPTPYYPGGSLSELFNRGGLLGGFAAGFLGAGLLGLLFGRGLFGGLGSAASYLGLLFQLALWVIVARLIWTRWRSAAGDAALSPRQLADPYLRSRDDLHAGFDRPAGPHHTDENAISPANGDQE